jgi:glycosyltransferase involved in cell wall biosynthesis
VLATSGLGTSKGGIGVVSEMLGPALQRYGDVRVWLHRMNLPRLLRKGLLAMTASSGLIERPDFVFYEHVHLAALHDLIPRLRSVPYGVFLHGMEMWEPLTDRRRNALERASILIANSATTERKSRLCNPWLPEVKITWLGVRTPGDVPRGQRRVPVALMVSRLASGERGKGHDEVFSAWPQIRASVPDARLEVVGTGDDLGRLKQRVTREGLKAITFGGAVTDLERDFLYRTSRVFLFPSRQEGFGLAGVEAAAWGLPLLGLAGTVMEELFPEPNGVVFVPNMMPTTLARYIIPILGAGSNFSDSHAAHRRVQEKFLRRHFLDRFCEALHPLLS